MSKGKIIYWFIGLATVTTIGFLVIPSLMKKYSNKLYKFSLKKDKIDFENMGPEVLKKEKIKGNKQMTIDTDKVAQEAIDAIAEKIKNLNSLNIIVAGKTGVGKSTLINAVFRDKLAETGMGKPVTDHMRKISKKGIPLAIYDTRGFELGKEVQQQVKQEVMETISNGLATKDINKAIHCIWYCINTASNRVEPEEIEWLKELSKENQITQVPIIVVLTQSFSKKNADAMRKMILNENLDVVQVVPVLAEDYEIDEEYVAKSYGLDVLIHVMGKHCRMS